VNGLYIPSFSRPLAALLGLTLATCSGPAENSAGRQNAQAPTAAAESLPPSATVRPAAEDAASAVMLDEETEARKWSRQGRPELAAAYIQRAIARRRARRELRWEAADRNFLGLELRRLGRPESSRRQFAAAEVLALEAGFLSGYAAAINNLGLLEEDGGHFAAAKSLYRKAWLTRSANLGDGGGDSAVYRENLARLLVGAGELAEAEMLLAPPGSPPSPEAQAELAWIQLLRHQPDRALATIDQALSVASDPWSRRILHDRRGTALTQLGSFVEAAAAYQRSAALSLGPTDAATIVNLCRLHTLDPDGGEAAKKACARAVAAAGQAGIPSAILASGLFWRAVQLHRGGRTGAAQRSATKAADLAGRRPLGVPDPARGARYFADRAIYLELAIRLAMELHRQDPQRGFDQAALADLELWRARAQGHRREIAAVLELRALQELLDDRTQVFDLMLAEPASYLWRVRRDEMASFQLPGAAVLEEAARRYLQLISDPRRLAQRGEAVVQGRRLAELLFGNRLERLRGAGDRLVFLGDGSLALFPIAALPTAASTAEAPRYLVEDLEIANLPSLPSLEELRRAPPSSATRALALVGDPWYDARRADVRLAPLSETEARQRLGRFPAFPLGHLPFAARELDLVRSHLPRSFAAWRLDGPDARRESVIAGGLGEFAVIHFSAHGTAEPSRPPALWLSEVGAGPLPTDGRLQATDLPGLEWQAEMVVISACRGFGGDTFRFAGTGGLARGFAQAGSRRTLAALWDVEGAATAALMDRFYAALLERRLAPAAALRAAQRELLDRARADRSDRQAPFYWGAFLHFGDWRGFSLPRPSRHVRKVAARRPRSIGRRGAGRRAAAPAGDGTNSRRA
jgi:CHAT domain-containing protein